MARYQVILESPLGERNGILTLNGLRDSVTGTLSLLGVENPVTGRWEGDTLALRHQLRTSLSNLECSTQLHAEKETLRGVIRIGIVHIPLRGIRIKEETEKEHDYGTADRT